MGASIYCNPCSKVVVLTPDADGKAPCPDCGALLLAPSSADVFISYAREDVARAREVANLLAAAGISHWLDSEKIELGKSFLNAIATGLVEAKVVVLILSSHAVKSPWVSTEITDAKGRSIPILPLMIESLDIPRPWRLLLAHHQWDEAFEQSFPTRAERLIERVKAELLSQAARAPEESAETSVEPQLAETPQLEGVAPVVSPYVGPRPFRSGMADRFFGRQHEAETLLRMICRARTVLVYAPSGAGKSSLINTLITRSLEDQGIDVMLGARVGGALPAHVNIDELRNVFTFSAIYGLENGTPPHPRWRLADYLKSFRRRPGTSGRVLVFDQFEEIFTQHRDRFEDRAGFFEDVVEALRADPSLRVIFASRQEFLADIDPLAEKLPEEYRLQRFALQRLGPAGAFEAITKPAERYAAFAPGVAEQIVEQLNTIRVPRSDGTLVEKRGEFIEMVHLQIVCHRLWSSLPPGITLIEASHVERAAGEGRTIAQFVINALNAFYDETIETVVNSEVTRRHGGYSKELIQLGCMKFVTPAATRTMVQRVNGRTGRLPDWIVEQLENSHLLRAEQRGGQHWYELSHDRLAEPVGRQLDRKVSSLLFAADLLNKVLENVQQEHGTLHGYFEQHRDVLTECRPFHSQTGLFPDESEFVFRASLTAGQDMSEWSKRLAQDYPQVRVEVLRDAMSNASAPLRRNAAALLGSDPAEELVSELVSLSVADADRSVRRTAALSLAQLDRADLYAALTAALEDERSHDGALEALSRIRIAADGSTRPAAAYEPYFTGLARGCRGRIRRAAWRLRLREGMAVFPTVFIPAATLAAVTAGLFKWIPGMFNWAVSQATASAAMGVFHGIIAGVVWAGLITLGITIYHTVFGREHGKRSMWRPFPAVMAGAASGFLSSLLVVLIVISVYEPTSLATMGWLAGSDVVRFSFEFWRDVFVSLRFGWVYLITGTGLGIGIALVTNAVRACPEWHVLMEEQSAGMTGLEETARVTRAIMRIVLPRAWPLPLAIALASVLAFMVPALPEAASAAAGALPAIDTKANAWDLGTGLIGDGITQAIGAYFGICGMALGLVVMRRGLTFESRRHHT